MTARMRFGCLSLLCALISCNVFSPENTETESPVPPGMKLIPAAGSTFMQGWSDTMATPDEKPGIASSLTYDFWIDSIEVTQGHFASLMKRVPNSDSSSRIAGDDFPVCNVTWFDAVLFCNARSNAEGFDTVYCYSGKDTTPTGSVYDLTGLRYDFSKSGYRLPTEAEWEFGARAGAAQQPFCEPEDSTEALAYGWYAANSLDASHGAAQKKANAFGLYDMAGNAFEWVNDWKGSYTGKAIRNPLGARWPNPQYERVIKGGSFRHGYLFLRPSIRTATYPTAVSSLAEYVGFRCAFGPVPSPAYFSEEPEAAPGNPVDFVENPLRETLTANRAKIAFVNVSGNARRLCVVDFGAAHPMVREFPDPAAVFCPSISPDGRHVAFATGNEGGSGLSSIFVRSIDGSGPVRQIQSDSCYVPRWWVDPRTRDTFLIYVNSAVDNTSAQWPASATYRQKMSGGSPVGEREAFITGGGFHDGISPGGRFAVTGYRQLLMRDLASGESRQLFTAPSNGKDAQASDQVYNVSVCPDPRYENRCLFLDFGYPRTSAITGASYGIHEYIFMTDFEGAIHAWIPKPAACNAWADVEWSNQYPFAIAGGTSIAESVPDIYIVNLTDRTPYRVLNGTELRQPALWMADLGANPDALSLDSLGRYNDPPLTDFQAAYSYKMHLLWKTRETLEVAFVGSSQIFSGIDCRQITGYTALNLGYGGCGVSGSTIIARDYLLNHCPKIKAICLSATPYWLTEPGGNAMDLDAMGITASKGYRYDQSHGFWKNGLPARFDTLMRNAPFHYCCEWDSFGLAPGSCDGWGGTLPDCSGRIDWTTDNAVYRQNVAQIKDLADQCAARGIHLVMIVFPESPSYKTTGYFGRGGPSWETGKAVIVELQALESENAFFHLYDAYQNGDHDYTDADAGNWNHLCPAGAAKLTRRIDTLLHGIMTARR